MKRRAEEVRQEVSRAYAEAVARPSPGRCCSGPVPKGVVVKLGGYSPQELASLPGEAVVNSFGCGNPVALAGLRAGDVVLDLGSGAGIDLFLAARKVGPGGRVIGIDMTDEMIARARANALAGGFGNVEVRKGIIEDLPVESGSIDWVISNCVINLSPEKPRVFREIARVLRPGGQMLVSDIVAEGLPEEILRDPAFYSSCIAGAIGEEQYLAGLRAAGLTGVEVRDRLVYDASEIEGVFGSEVETCCAAGIEPARMREVAGLLAGKVWSAKVYARKPV